MTTPLERRLLSAAALAAVLALPGWAQQAPAPEAGEELDAPRQAAPAEAEADPAAPEETAPAAPADGTGDPAAPAQPGADPAAAAGQAPAAPAQPATDPAAGAGQAPAASGAGAQPPEPEVIEIVREKEGDWEIRCLADGSECFLYQLALDAEENPVAEFSLVALPEEEEAAAGVTVVTPLGTLLPAGLAMQIDGGEARQYPFTFCSQVGCFARFGLTDEMIASMKRGRAARLQLVSIGAPQEPVELDLSLLGFTACYDSLAANPRGLAISSAAPAAGGSGNEPEEAPSCGTADIRAPADQPAQAPSE